MGLNVSKGNMYDFVTHTWNTVKGACPHDCSYCYMKRWGKLNPVRFDEKEMRTNLGKGNFIFVGSSCDMFAWEIPDQWIRDTLEHCERYDNKYLFQTKDPRRIGRFVLPGNSVVCTTIETNRRVLPIMQSSPSPIDRVRGMLNITAPKYITIEPIMDFDLVELVELIRVCDPVQVNIGADSGKNDLPEPGPEKVKILILLLRGFTVVKEKDNLKRIVNQVGGV